MFYSTLKYITSHFVVLSHCVSPHDFILCKMHFIRLKSVSVIYKLSLTSISKQYETLRFIRTNCLEVEANGTFVDLSSDDVFDDPFHPQVCHIVFWGIINFASLCEPFDFIHDKMWRGLVHFKVPHWLEFETKSIYIQHSHPQPNEFVNYK